ncbi:MAG: GGDEF domain-containing protein [Roseburia sp.]|nr:GGDEF domain-containing protein [Roseburia sp.]
MDKVNITEYKPQAGGYIAYYGKASLRKDYFFVDGDESFYHFVGKNSCYSMPDLLHPDDVEAFIRTVEKLSEGRQYVIVRMKNAENHYRLLYMELWRNGKIIDGYPSFSLEFCNFMEIKDRYITYVGIVKKYREFMSLSTSLYFEYTPATDEMNIYRYVNVKSEPLLRRPLEELRRNVNTPGKYSVSQQSEFEILYEFLKKGADYFHTSVDVSVFFEGRHGRCELKGNAFYNDNALTMIVGIMDIAGAEEAEKKYYLSDSAVDPGTGLFNKRAIHEYAMEKLQEGRSIYLAMIDVDDFKKINDGYGHMFGDEVLSKVSEIIRSAVDSRGMVGRFGGDEFMIVFDSVSDEEELRRILKIVSKHVEWAFQDIKDSLRITLSCGVSKSPDDGADFEELFRKSDKALYIAKEKGKNRYIIYDEKKHGNVVDEAMDERSIGIKAVVSDEKKAAEMSELVVTLYREGAEALGTAMEKLRSYFDIDGVAVYSGPDLHRVQASGKYFHPIEKLTYAQEQAYLKLFDANGVYTEGKLERLSGMCPELCRQYELQETKKLIQCAAFREGKPAALVSFDFFNRAPKTGATDFGLITIVGRLMAEVACGLD